MKAFITAEFSPEALAELKKVLKDDIVYESWRTTKNLYFSPEDLIARLNEMQAEVLICEGDNVKALVINQTNLKIIGSTRGDPNNIAIDTASAKGIPVLYAPNRNTQAVAELTLGLMLSLLRKLHLVERTVQGSEDFAVNQFSDYLTYYNMFMGRELAGKSVGIVGLGRIGFAVAKLLYAFNVKILVFDPYVNPSRLQAVNGQAVSLEELFRASDIVTLHCPPTDETDDLIGAELLGLLRPSALFLNLARASVVDQDALLEALKANKIAGAALDVFSIEPVDQDNEFLGLDNVIVTPHIGGDTQETNHRHSMLMVEGIKQILGHKIPLNIKNPQIFETQGWPGQEAMPSTEIAGIQVSLARYHKQTQEIIHICQQMVEKGFIVGTAGNVSARVLLPGGEEAFLVTPSSVDYMDMQPADIVLVGPNGDTICGTRNPTSERRLHLAIYRARPDIKAIVHSHAPYSTALSIARMPLGPIVDEIIPFIGGCEVAPFGMAGTDELAANAVQGLGENYAVFIANHGNVACGADLLHAWTVCQQTEMAAKIQYRASLLGTIYALPEEAEEAEREIFDIMREMNG